MYPDWALPEFYPPWLIQQARDAGCEELDEIHNYCTPRMRAMSCNDRGPEWLAKHYEAK